MNHVSFAIVLGAASLAASGQGTLTFSDQLARAEAYARTGTTLTGNFGQTQDFSGANFWGVEDRAAFVGNFSGRGYAELGATFSPANPMINGVFSSVVLDACTSAEIWTAESLTSEDRAYGLSRGVIEFDVLVAQNWNWIGAWQGSTYDSGAYYRVAGEISLVDSVSGAPIVLETRTSLNGIGDWFEPINLSGVLNPGSYALTWSHESVVANGWTPWGFFGIAIGGGPLLSCVNSTFSMAPVPTPGTVVLLGIGGLGAMRRRRG